MDSLGMSGASVLVTPEALLSVVWRGVATCARPTTSRGILQLIGKAGFAHSLFNDGWLMTLVLKLHLKGWIINGMTAGLLYMLERGDVGLTQEFRISQTTKACKPTNQLLAGGGGGGIVNCTLLTSPHLTWHPPSLPPQTPVAGSPKVHTNM